LFSVLELDNQNIPKYTYNSHWSKEYSNLYELIEHLLVGLSKCRAHMGERG